MDVEYCRFEFARCFLLTFLFGGGGGGGGGYSCFAANKTDHHDTTDLS